MSTIVLLNFVNVYAIVTRVHVYTRTSGRRILILSTYTDVGINLPGGNHDSDSGYGDLTRCLL